MLSTNIRRVLESLKAGRSTASELCEKCLRRVEKTRELNAFITVLNEPARKAAKDADNSLRNNKSRALEGLPIAVKDNFCTTGVRTTCASNMLRDFVPPYSATVVSRLIRDSGAVLIGKTNLDEFAMGCGSVDGAFGPVRNPWKYRFALSKKQSKRTSNLAESRPSVASSAGGSGCSSPDEAGRDGTVSGTSTLTDDWFVSGGSSGGSAVAVASGCVFAALGSDTGGSTRNPASYCGVVGLKPSYGLLSRHGLIPLVNSMDVPGILTKSVDDAALILNVLAGHDPLDSTTVRDSFTPVALPDEPSVKGLTVGIPIEYHAPGLSTETVSRWQHVVDLLADNGANIRQVSLPHTQYSIVCYHVLCACEVCSNMARYDGLEYGHRAQGLEHSTEQLYAATRHEGFNNVVRGRILAGNYFLLKQNYEKYFLQAQKIRRLITEDFDKVFRSGVDLLLTPTVLGDAPDYRTFSAADNRTRTQEQDVFTQPANLAGVPAITLPVGLSSRGLPIGLQLIGRHYDEQTLLLAAKAVERLVSFTPLDLSALDN